MATGIVHGPTGPLGQAASHAVTGARVVFKLSGNKVAWATSVSYTINHMHEPVNVLDQLEPEEYAEVGYYVNFSASGFRIPGFSAIGQNAGGGFMPKLSDILFQPELTAEITDKITGQTILTVKRCKCIERSGSIGARDLATETWNFVGISAGDEGCNQDPGVTPQST